MVREAFISEADAKDIAAKYEIAQSTLSEWKKEALSGKDSKRGRELEKKLARGNLKRQLRGKQGFTTGEKTLLTISVERVFTLPGEKCLTFPSF